MHTPPLQRDALSQVGASALAALAAAPLVQCFEVVAVAALSWLVAAVLAAVLLAAVLLVALARLDPTSLPSPFARLLRRPRRDHSLARQAALALLPLKLRQQPWRSPESRQPVHVAASTAPRSAPSSSLSLRALFLRASRDEPPRQPHAFPDGPPTLPPSFLAPLLAPQSPSLASAPAHQLSD